MMRVERKGFTTPIGTLAFPVFLDEPDTKFAADNDENDKGEFKSRLIVSESDSEGFRNQVDEMYSNYIESLKEELGKKKIKTSLDNLPYFPELDDDDEPTGNYVFRFKLTARVNTRDGRFFDQAPRLFDASNNHMIESPNVGPGTKCRIAGVINPWYNGGKGAGLSLWLQGVQIIELHEKGNLMRDGEDFGFSKTSGFEAPADEVSPFGGDAIVSKQEAGENGDF